MKELITKTWSMNDWGAEACKKLAEAGLWEAYKDRVLETTDISKVDIGVLQMESYEPIGEDEFNDNVYYALRALEEMLAEAEKEEA